MGWRNFNDWDKFCNVVKEYVSKDLTIVTGDAKGTDAMARRYAQEHNIKLIVKKADWNAFGKGAGPVRNLKIVKESNFMIAFPSPLGSGTQNSIELARKHNVKIIKIENV